MYAISDQFNTYLAQRNRNWLVKANIADTDYSNAVIVDFEVENSLISDVEFELGTAIISKLTLRLKTTDAIAANAKVIPYVALTGTDGDTEWFPLGEFYIDDREEINGVWTFSCLDKLVWANAAYTSALSYPATMQDVWDEICASLSYTSDASVVIDPTYTIAAAPVGYTKRQVMGHIASANAACVYVGKDGTINFRTFNVDDEPVIALSDAEYFQAKQTNPEKYYTKIIVTYDKDNQLTYTAGTGDDNHILYLTNPFATQSIVDDLLTALNGFHYIPATLPVRAYPQIEAGDRIRYGHYVGTPAWEDADTAWGDTAYSWDGYTSGGYTLALHSVYSFKGGLKMTIEAPSKSEQQSEFDMDGSLTNSVKDIRKNAVRTDKTYFGVSITDEDGIIVERSDHASELIINSDVLLDWTIGGVHKLYYDEVDDELKFEGTINASKFISGTVTGSLIQTAEAGTYPRIEFSSGSQLIKAELDADSSISMYANLTGDPGFRFLSSAAEAIISIALDTSFFQTLAGNIRIEANDNLFLSAGGLVKFDSWSEIYSSGASQSLQSALDAKANVFSGRTGSALVKASDGTTNLELVFNNGICTAINVL